MSAAAAGDAVPLPPGVPPTADALRATSCSLVGGCSADTPLVPEGDLPGLLAAVPAWTLAVDFVNRVVPIAEAEGHHPDLHITNWRDVEVVLSTHAIGGLSLSDFVVAVKLDSLPVTYSPQWLKKQQAAGAAVPGAAAAPAGGGGGG
ncbi:hypothetical protein Rsub_08447 [Raphidocelis subcapitata]|uniref:4a-hydroxytetrahydrobiopterin dehydratase n=1 Tax=Raphidocelis subcapitata TaxID=307507 RepID=A0A2V0P7P2_9CHLO|nr:hypothetical protein Rsub_08447 [Raphidocelis subcapitata]|eukprot:GBF95856.1 hypothetical protein Rsub_08447 [Raphidocelis subcapitata]